jgi:hypothetical protein
MDRWPRLTVGAVAPIVLIAARITPAAITGIPTPLISNNSMLFTRLRFVMTPSQFT